MVDNKKKIEAILFTTGRFLSLEEISQYCSIVPIDMVKKILETLKKDYQNKDSALEIVNENNKWKLNIKKEHLYLTEKLLEHAEMNKPIQETLAVIAYKQPAIQSDVVKIRGNKSYDHISFLEENGFVIGEKFGRTKLLKLTEKFYDYFDVVKEQLVERLKIAEQKIGEMPKIEEIKEEKETKDLNS
jgi:segregation and condensation protein B